MKGVFRYTIIFISIFFLAGSGLSKKNNYANRLYHQGRYAEAIKLYRNAQVDSPESKELHYNIANVLYSTQKYPEAQEEYDLALGKDDDVDADAYYNLGNTLYRMGKLKEAVDYYKRCLYLRPNDEDAKYNIEYIQERLKGQLAQERQSQAEKDKSAGQEEDKTRQKSDKQGQGSPPAQGDDTQEPQSPRPAGSVQNSEKQGMSKEDVLRILQALDEGQNRRRHIAAKTYTLPVEKDW